MLDTTHWWIVEVIDGILSKTKQQWPQETLKPDEVKEFLQRTQLKTATDLLERGEGAKLWWEQYEMFKVLAWTSILSLRLLVAHVDFVWSFGSACDLLRLDLCGVAAAVQRGSTRLSSEVFCGYRSHRNRMSEVQSRIFLAYFEQ